jgi:tRNA pseudouridine55 synthase
VDGFLNLHKLADWTSHDCVAKVRGILRTKKVGHGGTLDPAATGVLPIAIGKATRLLPYLPTGKSYRARIKFGIQTTTDDLEGEVSIERAVPELTLDRVRSILPQFIGKIQQVPPLYSAIQINGQRLYKLARAGESIDIPAREVIISQINILNWTSGDFPELELEISCGGGTYIRSIARDMGTAMGTHGTLAHLIRTASCGFMLADSITLADLQQLKNTDSFTPLPPLSGLNHLPKVTLTEELVKRWYCGQRLPLTDMDRPIDPCVVVDEEVKLLGIGKLTAIANSEGYLLSPHLVLSDK